MDEVRAGFESETGGQGPVHVIQRHARTALDQLEQRHIERREIVGVAGCRIEYDSFLFKGFDLETGQSYRSRDLSREMYCIQGRFIRAWWS